MTLIARDKSSFNFFSYFYIHHSIFCKDQLNSFLIDK